ncbi:hypothetical protein L218DRAFT_480427 [Marasmius fiardii PR-910]|nr:hypothetical protein L218DRAFT_480427 [Marasmius fiardii PR-910]
MTPLSVPSAIPSLPIISGVQLSQCAQEGSNNIKRGREKKMTRGNKAKTKKKEKNSYVYRHSSSSSSLRMNTPPSGKLSAGHTHLRSIV